MAKSRIDEIFRDDLAPYERSLLCLRQSLAQMVRGNKPDAITAARLEQIRSPFISAFDPKPSVVLLVDVMPATAVSSQPPWDRPRVVKNTFYDLEFPGGNESPLIYPVKQRRFNRTKEAPPSEIPPPWVVPSGSPGHSLYHQRTGPGVKLEDEVIGCIDIKTLQWQLDSDRTQWARGFMPGTTDAKDIAEAYHGYPFEKLKRYWRWYVPAILPGSLVVALNLSEQKQRFRILGQVNRMRLL